MNVVRKLVTAAILVLGLVVVPAAGATTGPGLSGSISADPNLSGATSVAISGHYAYTTAYFAGELTAVDFSNPAAPVVSGSSAFSNGLLNASTVNIAGGYAYVVSKNRNGTNGSGSNDDGTGNSLTILDISTNPAKPQIVGSVHDATKLFGGYGVAFSGHYAYIAAQGCLGGQPCPNASVGNSFEVVDVSNPAAPTIVATLRNTALPAPFAGTNALDHACSVAISGHYAYVTAAYSNRLTIIDISNPLAPVIVSSILDNNQLSFPVDVVVKGNYAYVADQATSLGRIAVVDVSNPANPQIKASVTDSATLNGAYRIRVSGNFAYVSGVYAATVDAIDISNPLVPREAGHLTDTTHLNRTTGLDVDPTAKYVVASSPYLSSQSNPTYPPFAPAAGAPAATGTLSVVQLDRTPISVSITAKPANPTTQTSASFTFASADSVATLACGLDGAPLGSCTSATTQVYSGLAPGPHTFTVQTADAAGNPASASYTWTVQAAPVNTVAPSISGTATLNGQLTAANGTWTGLPAPTFTYSWSDCDVNGANCKAISGTNSSTYTAQSTDVGSTLEVTVTGTNSAGASSATSPPTAVVSSPPVNKALPSISGTASQGSQLTASNGTWTGTPAPTFTYSWSDCDVNGANCSPISGTNSSTYTAQASDAGSTLEVTVTGTNTAGSASATSGPSAVVSSPPVAIVPPGISGTASSGGQLTASPGTWTGTPAPTYTYSWSDCDVNGANCSPISNANSSSYTVQSTDVGSTLEVTVTGTNTVSSSAATSGPTAVVTSAPANTVLPTISGTATPGGQLTASNGTWTGSPAPTYTYSWSDCDVNGANCSPISSTNSSSYTVQSTDVGSTLEVTVTGTNSAGSSSATSPPTAVVTSPPVNTAAPAISGTAAQGSQLTASNGTWTGTPAPTFTYSWSDCDVNGANCSPISNTNSSTYTAQSTDVGSTLEVTVTGTNTSGSSAATSGPTAVVGAPPVNTAAPGISGTTSQGSQLTASTGTWTGTPAPTFTYSWSDCDVNGANCSPISNTNSSTYTAQSTDAGSTLKVTVTGTNTVGSASATSGPTAVVGSPPANTALPMISGTASQGSQLTASNGTWTGTPAPTFTYSWSDCDVNGANCKPISTANSSTYTAQGSDAGSTLEVTVTGSNGVGSSASATSGPTAVVSSPPVNSAVPAISGSAVEAQTLTASTGTWSGVPAPTFAYSWSDCNASGASCNPISGANSATYTAVAADVGSTLKVTVTATNSAGSPQATSTASAVVTSAPGPVTSLLDNFNRSNTAGPPSSSWSHTVIAATNATSDIAITGQQGTGVTNANAADYWNPQTFGPNSEDWITITARPSVDQDSVSLGLRIQNPASATTSGGYQAYYIYRSTPPDQYKIVLRPIGQSGAVTLTSANGPTLSPGDHLLFRAIGSTLELWRQSGHDLDSNSEHHGQHDHERRLPDGQRPQHRRPDRQFRGRDAAVMDGAADGRKAGSGKRARVPALDGLRGIAASVVVIHHLVLATVPSIANTYYGKQGTGVSTLLSPLSVLWSGPAFVIVFFVLSGLVLALPAARGKRFNAAAYYPARMIRLYVPVWGALIVAFVLHEIYTRHANPHATWWLNAHAVGLRLSPAAHDASLVFGTGGFGLTSVLWSLRWEVLFSLFLPLFIWLAHGSRRWHLPLAALAFTVIFISGSHQGAHYMPTFLLGTLIAFNMDRIMALPQKLAAHPSLNRVIKPALVIVALGMLGCSRWVHVTNTTTQGLVGGAGGGRRHAGRSLPVAELQRRQGARDPARAMAGHPVVQPVSGARADHRDAGVRPRHPRPRGARGPRDRCLLAGHRGLLPDRRAAGSSSRPEPGGLGPQKLALAGLAAGRG